MYQNQKWETAKALEIYRRVGVKPPDYIEQPEYSYIASTILNAYQMISRSRQYEQGIPMPIDLSAITMYLEHYEAPCEVWMFNDCMITLDNLFIEEAYKKT